VAALLEGRQESRQRFLPGLQHDVKVPADFVFGQMGTLGTPCPGRILFGSNGQYLHRLFNQAFFLCHFINSRSEIIPVDSAGIREMVNPVFSGIGID